MTLFRKRLDFLPSQRDVAVQDIFRACHSNNSHAGNDKIALSFPDTAGQSFGLCAYLYAEQEETLSRFEEHFLLRLESVFPSTINEDCSDMPAVRVYTRKRDDRYGTDAAVERRLRRMARRNPDLDVNTIRTEMSKKIEQADRPSVSLISSSTKRRFSLFMGSKAVEAGIAVNISDIGAYGLSSSEIPVPLPA